MQTENLLDGSETIHKRDIIHKDMHLVFCPSFYSEEKCIEILHNLSNLDFNSDQESQVLIRGEWINIPRKQVSFSDPDTRGYRFAGTRTKNRSWPKFLDEIRDEINNHLIEWGILGVDAKCKLNFALVNLYIDGEHYIGPHRDAEQDLQLLPYSYSHDNVNVRTNEAIIVSLSFGATRDFVFHNIEASAIKFKLPLKNGDLLIMRGLTNKKWKHSLPKRKKVTEPRYNITFRIMRID